jgi:hypothetical protein
MYSIGGSNTYQEEENSVVHIWPADGYKGRILLVLERKNHMQALGLTGMSCRRRQAEQAVIGGIFLNCRCTIYVLIKIWFLFYF